MVLIILRFETTEIQFAVKSIEGITKDNLNNEENDNDNLLSFASFSYKIRLIRTSVDRAYKINYSLLLFNNDVKNLTHIFKRNHFPRHLTNKVAKAYLDNNINSASSSKNDTLYFKLPSSLFQFCPT